MGKIIVIYAKFLLDVACQNYQNRPMSDGAIQKIKVASFFWNTVYMQIFVTGFVQTVKYCFSGLSRTCKNQIPGFSRTHKTRLQGLLRINSVHKNGCIRSKKCTYQISYQCICITVTVFLKFKLTQKVTNCTQRFTMNFFSS